MNLNLLTYVGIGLGTISGLHDSKLQEAGCLLAAAIDPKSDTHAKASSQTPAFFSFEEFLNKNEMLPNFWDVRTPNDSHFAVMRQISRISSIANIIVEKPVCLPDEVNEFKSFLKNHRGKICVNENYLQSNTTKEVKQYVERFLKEIKQVNIEMTKNRTEDFKKGRYQDKRGAFMYEGSHMLSILKQLDASLVPTAESLKQRANIVLTDAVIEGDILPFQGSAKINYETDTGIQVELYSSMEGKVRNGYFFHRIENNILEEIQNEEINDAFRRHRIVVIHGEDSQGIPTTILGFYDPFTIEKSNVVAGAVFAIKNNQILDKTFSIPDDTMSNNLRAIIEYFKDGRDNNPSSAEDAIQIVEVMDTLTSKASE